jgi:RND family efflux transporter MFP subunit
MIAGAAVLLALLAIVGILLGRGAADADKDASGTAFVSLARIESGPIEDIVDATGLTQADPSGAMTVASPRPAIVQQVMVRPGQEVRAGEPLVIIADAPASALAYAQALHARDFAKRDLERVRRLVAGHLAADDQLSQAEKSFADAESGVLAQQAQGGGQSRQTLTSPADGVVLTIPVSPGDRVAEGVDLVTLSGAKAAVARLWVNPQEGARLTVGADVRIAPIYGHGPINSHLTHVGRLVDGVTHMLDAEASLAGANLAVGAPVKAQIITGSHVGLSVPRGAVVFDDTGAHVFSIDGGKARRVGVTVGREQSDVYEVKGDLKAGQVVAVAGAYQLEDGMAVRTRQP